VASAGGDSGGPWYAANTALGLRWGYNTYSGVLERLFSRIQRAENQFGVTVEQHGVRPNLDVHIEITRPSAPQAHVAAFRHPQPRAIHDTGRDPDRSTVIANNPALSGTPAAPLMPLAACAAATGASLREHHVPARPANASAALALRAPRLLHPELPGAAAHSARHLPRDHDVPLGAAHRLLEGDRHGGMEIRAGLLFAAVGLRHRVQRLGEELAERGRLISLCGD
jgi:hypothetical protein